MTAIPQIIIDFDSTLIQVEALDELAALVFRRHPKRRQLVAQIAAITKQGMEGKLPFERSLQSRLDLLKPARADILKLSAILKQKVTSSFWRNREFLRANRDRIYIVSSGFEEYIGPVVEHLGLKPQNVRANRFRFSARQLYQGVEKKNPLTKTGGKAVAVKGLKLKGEVVVIGDGVTDLEIREAGLATKFFALTENVRRESVLQSADKVIKSFDEFLYEYRLPMRFSYPKSKITALLLEGVHPAAVSALEAEGYGVIAASDALGEQELAEAIEEVSLLGIRSKTKITDKVLKRAKRLMAVGAFCIGTEQIDLAAASARGVCVFNAPFSNTRSVVELALGEIIMLMRRTFEASVKLHQGVWHKSAAGSYEVRGKRLGIVGYGNIGSQLSILAENLGMEVYFYDVVDKLALGNARKCATLDELLKSCDIVTLHVDGRASNRNLIAAKQLDLMRAGAILLNLSRGTIVDLSALAQALKAGKIAGASIDVFPREPKSNKERFESDLLGMPNVILTPHIGGSTLEAQENIGAYVSRKLVEYVNTGGTFFSVNFPQIQLPALEKAHRLLHLHRNVPGILAKINGILAAHRINILGQHLKTNEQVGYVITDVNKSYNKQVIEELSSIPHTIKFRVLY
ncbi:MAG: phosphoglycerate dehydrogenase [Oligoflexia bacterium]|nr:phosphoglycerate dehydrogenase [Oligoflexia bacterium]